MGMDVGPRVALLLALVVGTFAACSNTTTPATTGEADNGAPLDTAAEDAAPDVGADDVQGPPLDAALDAAKDVQAEQDVGPAAEITYVTNVDSASDPTGAAATVGQNATLSLDVDVVYPPNNAMAPRDFAPITVQWTYAGTDANLFIVRFENPEAEIDVMGDLANLADAPGYSITIPDKIWAELFAYPDHPDWTLRVIAANVQNQQLVGKMVSSKPLAFHVSNQKVGGAVYYWNTTMSAVRVLEAGQLQPTTLPGGGGMMACVGCHSVSPDGSAVAVSSFFGGGGGFSTMSMNMVSGKSGKPLTWLSPKAQSQLATSFTISAAFSQAYFTATSKWLVVPQNGKLRSVNLLTGDSYAMVSGGDLGQQAFPTWSNDGSTIVYASAKDVGQGFSGSVATSLYRVDWNGGTGGQATVIPGADEPGIFHYYPALSVDGDYVVYNRADPSGPTCPSSGSSGGPSSGGGATTYDNCNAELWMIATQGGVPIRLDNANQSTDPLTNSWPTFGNVVGDYYWMAFSSRRDYGFKHTGNPASPQVYIAAVDRKKLDQGQDGSYAALWLPGPDISSGCHIARWSAKPRD